MYSSIVFCTLPPFFFLARPPDRAYSFYGCFGTTSLLGIPLRVKVPDPFVLFPCSRFCLHQMKRKKKKNKREPVSVATQYKKLLLSPSLPPIFSHSFQSNHSSFLASQSSLADLQKEASILSPSPTLRLISSHLLFCFLLLVLVSLEPLSLFPLPNPHPIHIHTPAPPQLTLTLTFSWTEYGTPYPHSFSHQCQVPVSSLAAYPISLDSCACFRLITSCRRQQGPLFRHASKEAFNSSRFPLCFF